jgi:CRP-like cAMP-binding protein
MGAVLTHEPMVRFIVSGAVGIFPAPGSSCVALMGPGNLHGLDRCFAGPAQEHLVALMDVEIIETPAEAFCAATGRAWTERMFGHQATGRLRAMAAEAACGTRHTVARRTARWLAKLSRASNPPRRIEMTQALLAEVLGVQRTTVNAELCALQAQGVISTVRGSVTVLSENGLKAAACDCDAVEGLVPTESLGRACLAPPPENRRMQGVGAAGSC